MLRGGFDTWAQPTSRKGFGFPTCSCKAAACSKMEGQPFTEEAPEVQGPKLAPTAGGGLLVCVADSVPLFSPWWRENVRPMVDAVVQAGDGSRRMASYLGASNYDNPTYFEMFEGVAKEVGIDKARCVHVSADNGRQKVQLVAEESALVVLGGGDCAAGWESFEKCGLIDALRRAAAGGAVLVGVAEGAVQLGTHGYRHRAVGGVNSSDYRSGGMPMSNGPSSAPNPSTPMLGLAPYVFGAHDEANDWKDTRSALRGLPSSAIALGLSSGSGVVVHPDGAVSPFKVGKDPPVVLDGDDTAKLAIGEKVGFRKNDHGRVLLVTHEGGDATGRESARRAVGGGPGGANWNAP